MIEFWIITGLLGAFINCFSNYIDQYTGRIFFKDRPMPQALMNGQIYILFIIPILLFAPTHIYEIDIKIIIGLIVSGCLLFGTFFPYFAALQRKNADQAVPLLQIIPILTAFLGWLILGETLNGWEIVSCIFVVGGAMALLFDFKLKQMAFAVIGYMFVVTFLIALSNIITRFFSYELEWYIITFWTFFGMFIGSVIAGTIKFNAQIDLFRTIKASNGKVLFWTTLLQISDLATLLSLIYTMAHAPTAAHATLMLGAQPIFLIFFAIMAHKIFPKAFPQDGHVNHIAFRIGAGLSIVFGLYLMTL